MSASSDILYALRTLRRSPGFTIAALLSLALGIGSTSAIFSIVNGLLLHPAGIEHPEQLVAPRVDYKKLNLDKINLSTTDFADIRNSKQVFSDAAIGQTAAYNYTAGDSPERLVGGQVSWTWFNVFGAKPILGRSFRADDDQPGANRVAILTYDTWQRLFGAEPSIVGRIVELNKEPYRVVGVMPAAFHKPEQAALWVPLGLPVKAYGPENRFNESYFVIARLRQGVDFHQAAQFMPVLTNQIIAHDPQGSFAKASQWDMIIEPYTEFSAGRLKAPMLILLCAVAFVLLIACSNIAGLLLVRGTGRARDLAIRAALGASRPQLLKQAFIESLVLSAGGTLIGVAAAAGILRVLLTLAPPQLTTGVVIQMDGYVMGFAIVVGVVSALLFGLAPAWHISGFGQRYEQLKEGGRSDTAGVQRQRLRAALVASQVALALILLVGAGLFLKSLSKLRDVDTGFHPHGLLTASVSLPSAQYKEEDKQVVFFRSVLNNLAQTPGATNVAATQCLPFSGDDSSASFQVEGRVNSPGDPGPHGDIRQITPSYFAALGIPLLRGRFFSNEDRKGSQAVVIVDRNLAEQYWPNQDPLGRRLRLGNDQPWATVIGVVGHIKHGQLAADSGKGVYYYPLYQLPAPQVYLILRAAGSSGELSSTIGRAVHAVDSTQAVFDQKTMEQRIDSALGPQSFAVILLSAFSGAALFLAALGLYGVISYGVTQRTRELGIRAALGANRGQILGMVIGQGMRLVAVGAFVGFIGAAALAHVVSAQLFGISPFDLPTFCIMAVILGSAAMLAVYIPAWRATKVDPLTALRYE